MDEYFKCKNFLRENKKSVYSIVWGQCTDYMRQKLEAKENYETFNDAQDPFGLLKEIKSITFKFEEHRYIYHSLYESYRMFYAFRQTQEMGNTEYLEQFKNLVDVLEQHGGSLGHDVTLLDQDDEYGNEEEPSSAVLNAAKARCRNRFLGYTLIYKSDNERYSKLKEELQNDYMKGSDNYPETLVEAFHMLTNYKQPIKPRITRTTGVSFAQKGKGNNNNRNNHNNN